MLDTSTNIELRAAASPRRTLSFIAALMAFDCLLAAVVASVRLGSPLPALAVGATFAALVAAAWRQAGTRLRRQAEERHLRRRLADELGFGFGSASVNMSGVGALLPVVLLVALAVPARADLAPSDLFDGANLNQLKADLTTLASRLEAWPGEVKPWVQLSGVTVWVLTHDSEQALIRCTRGLKELDQVADVRDAVEEPLVSLTDAKAHASVEMTFGPARTPAPDAVRTALDQRKAMAARRIAEVLALIDQRCSVPREKLYVRDVPVGDNAVSLLGVGK